MGRCGRCPPSAIPQAHRPGSRGAGSARSARSSFRWPRSWWSQSSRTRGRACCSSSRCPSSRPPRSRIGSPARSTPRLRPARRARARRRADLPDRSARRRGRALARRRRRTRLGREPRPPTGRAWTNRVLAAARRPLRRVPRRLPHLADGRLPRQAAQSDRPEGARPAAERVTFAASDGVRLSGWYVRSRNGSAVVLVHGGGGDRQGTIRHARMIAGAGYGVLLYDARGRGESAGHENAAGWEWDRDVRGAVSYLTSRGIHRVALVGLSTGAEAVVTEAARTRASRQSSPTASRDAPRATLPTSAGNRISLQPAFALRDRAQARARREAAEAAVTLVREVARTRPLLSRDRRLRARVRRAYTRGTTRNSGAAGHGAHEGPRRPPVQYRKRVLSIFRLAHL